MIQGEQCIHYNKSKSICEAGFASKVSSLCTGVYFEHHNNLPHCLRDEIPKQLVRDDGFPVFYPIKEVKE